MIGLVHTISHLSMELIPMSKLEPKKGNDWNEEDTVAELMVQVRSALLASVRLRKQEDRNFSLRKLSEFMGKDISQISRWLSPGKNLSLRTIASLVHHLNMKPVFKLEPVETLSRSNNTISCIVADIDGSVDMFVRKPAQNTANPPTFMNFSSTRIPSRVHQ